MQNDVQRDALSHKLSSFRPRLLAVGWDDAFIEASQREFDVIECFGESEVIRQLEPHTVAVLLLGPKLPPREAHRILAACHRQFPSGAAPTNILVGVGSAASLFQEFVDRDLVFYIARGPLTSEQLRPILLAASDRFRAKSQTNADTGATGLAITDLALEFCDRLTSQNDLPGMVETLVEAVQVLLDADRAQCLIYDGNSQILTAPGIAGTPDRVESAASGLLAFCARTGEGLCIDRVGGDPRFDAEADDPNGDGTARFLAEPVRATRGGAVAVISAVRNGDREPFSMEQVEQLQMLASCAAPGFNSVLAHDRIQATLEDRLRVTRGPDIYLKEALDQHNLSWQNDGDLLRTSAGWLRWAHWLTVAMLLAGLSFVSLAKIDEYATGPAIIRARNKLAVTANSAGLVRTVSVSAGDRVRAGDLLIQFFDPFGAAAPDRLRGVFTAPADGVISDLRVRKGQQVTAGDQLASIIDEGAGYEAIAMLPGSYAPLIQRNMSMTLKFAQYADSHETVPVERISEEIVGPREAARFIGPESADTLSLAGPVIVVRSSLGRSRFVSGGRSYAVRDGMTGQAEIRVRSEPMLLSLLPGLKELFRR